jgi:hypothetical protein
MSAVIIGLVALAAISLGLRTTSVLLEDGVHPVGRLLLSIAAGTLITMVILELTESYGVFELGLGLLLSLSPVGVFDLLRWWFRWQNRPDRRQLQ